MWESFIDRGSCVILVLVRPTCGGGSTSKNKIRLNRRCRCVVCDSRGWNSILAICGGVICSLVARVSASCLSRFTSRVFSKTVMSGWVAILAVVVGADCMTLLCSLSSSPFFLSGCQQAFSSVVYYWDVISNPVDVGVIFSIG
ncbi:unnamed protein product [Arabis nemorensis]|uniref:Uncharacterized protein n=1 Tax=Arabis nemorensis TaxID=586526 RepID=A0A565CCU2_9BRAS|nr:unnamed protein product [Arabis nemorensis]